MRFTQFLEIFGSFNYEPPEDKEQQLYDFYMFSLLWGRSSFQKNVEGRPATDIPAPTKVGDLGNEDKIDYMLGEVAEKLLPTLKKNLLEAVLFAVCAELRHVYDYLEKDQIGYLLGFLDKNEQEAFKKYTKYYLLYKNNVYTTMNPGRVPNPQEKVFKNAYEPYMNSYKAYLKAGISPYTFMTMAEKLFNKASWASHYGGKAWANIARGWVDLFNAKNTNQMMVQIDHVYDLQHNTDTVFNKLQSYAKDEDFSWIKKALDHKAKIKNPYEIMDKISVPLKQLAQRAIWVKFGISKEEFDKEKHKYQQEKEEKPKLSTHYDDDGYNPHTDPWNKAPGGYYSHDEEEDQWELDSTGLKKYHKKTGEILHYWGGSSYDKNFSGNWITEKEYDNKKQEAKKNIQDTIEERIPTYRSYASNVYRAVTRILGYGYNGAFHVSNFMNWNDKGQWMQRQEEFAELVKDSLNLVNFNGTLEEVLQMYCLRRLGINPTAADLSKIQQEITKESKAVKFFDTQWNYNDVSEYLNGKNSAFNTSKAKEAVMDASQVDIGLNTYAMNRLSTLFHDQPKNKIALIKEFRHMTNWGLKASKAVGEYIMTYELLTNPSGKTMNIIKAGY